MEKKWKGIHVPTVLLWTLISFSVVKLIYTPQEMRGEVLIGAIGWLLIGVLSFKGLSKLSKKKSEK